MSDSPGSEGAERDGLRGPHHSTLDLVEPPARRSLVGWIVNSVGFLIGVAILVWSARLALGDSPRASLDRLLGIDALWLGVLCALSAISVTLNAGAFWVTVLRAHRLPFARLLGVNVIATFLAPLPFKLGAVARIMIHRRWDQMRYKVILAWFAAVGLLAAACLAPVALAATQAARIGDLWWVVALVCGGLGASVCVGAGRVLERSVRLRGLSLGAGDMLGSWSVCFGNFALRVADVAAHSARFALAASALQVDLAVSDALLLGATYFVIGASAPTGSLGVREGAVIGLGVIAPSVSVSGADLASMALLISATELATLLALIGPSAWIVLRGSKSDSAATDPARD